METIRAVHKDRQTRWQRLIALLLLLAVVATACGSDGDVDFGGDSGVGDNPDCVEPPAGLSAWWTFDEEEGPYTDIAQQLVLDDGSGGVSSIAGQVKAGIDVGTSSLHGSTVEAEALAIGTGDFSIDAWINPGTRDAIAILDTRASTTDTRGLLFRTYQHRLLLQINEGNNDFLNVESTMEVPEDQWSLVSVSVDRNGDTSFTINGVNAGTVASPRPGIDVTTGRKVEVGYDVYLDQNWGGQIDELEVFNVVVPDSEFTRLFDAGQDGKCRTAEIPPPSQCVEPPASLVAWWTFDEVGSAYVDRIGGLQVDPMSAAVTTTSGTVASAVDFGGDYLSATSTIGNLDGLGDFSIDAWINPGQRSEMAIFDTRASKGDTEGVLFRVFENKLLMQLNEGGNSFINVISTDQVPADQWSLVSVSVDRDGDTSFTINGDAAGVEASPRPDADINLGRIAVGRDMWFGSNWGGQVDELEVFNEAVADDFFFELYDAMSDGKCRDGDGNNGGGGSTPQGDEIVCSMDFQSGQIPSGSTVTASVANAPAGATFEWEFDQAQYTTMGSPTKAHTYINTGFFKVRVFVDGDEYFCGEFDVLGSSTECPEAFEPKTAVLVGQDFQVTANGYVEWWDMGDGNPVLTTDPATYSYSSPGTYIVTGANNAGDSFDCEVVVVANAAIECDVSGEFEIGETVSFTITETPNVGHQYRVNWGDQSASVSGPAGAFSHVYQQAGIFTVLVEFDINGTWERIPCGLGAVEIVGEDEPPPLPPTPTVTCPAEALVFGPNDLTARSALTQWVDDNYDGQAFRPYGSTGSDEYFNASAQWAPNVLIHDVHIGAVITNGGSNDALGFAATYPAAPRWLSPLNTLGNAANGGIALNTTGVVDLWLSNADPSKMNQGTITDLLGSIQNTGNLDIVVQDDSAVHDLQVTVCLREFGSCQGETIVFTPDNLKSREELVAWVSGTYNGQKFRAFNEPGNDKYFHTSATWAPNLDVVDVYVTAEIVQGGSNDSIAAAVDSPNGALWSAPLSDLPATVNVAMSNPTPGSISGVTAQSTLLSEIASAGHLDIRVQDDSMVTDMTVVVCLRS